MALTETVSARAFRDWRRRLGLTQAELASLLYVDVATVCRWETGVHAIRGARLAQLAAVAGQRKVPLRD